MYHVPLALQCIYGRSDEGSENGDGEEGKVQGCWVGDPHLASSIFSPFSFPIVLLQLTHQSLGFGWEVSGGWERVEIA